MTDIDNSEPKRPKVNSNDRTETESAPEELDSNLSIESVDLGESLQESDIEISADRSSDKGSGPPLQPVSSLDEEQFEEDERSEDGSDNSPSLLDSDSDVPATSSAPPREKLTWHKEFDLKIDYPVSPLYVVQHTIWWFLLCIAAWIVYIYAYGFSGVIYPESLTQNLLLLAVRGLFATFLGLLLYWELFRRTMEYRMDGFRLIVSHGVLFKIRGSIPLVPVMQIYVRQTGIDVMFDLYRLEMYTPLTPRAEYTIIPGLSYLHAQSFQKFLTDELNRQIFIVNSAGEPVTQMSSEGESSEGGEGGEGND